MPSWESDAPRRRRLLGTGRRLLGRVARAAGTLGRIARARLSFVGVLLSSWLATGRALVRLRTEQHRLEGEHRELISALGWAVYHGDLELADTFESAARACSAQIERCDRKLEGQVEQARARVARERLAVRRTTVLAGGDER